MGKLYLMHTIYVNYHSKILCILIQLLSTRYFQVLLPQLVRYIDDILIIWPHGIDTLDTFLQDANRTHPNISFTHEYSTTAVLFSDVIIKINNGIIATS